MGSVYKRGPFWWVGFKVAGTNKHQYRSTGIPSDRPKTEALRMLAAIERELSSGAKQQAHAKMTVAEWTSVWTETRKANRQTNAAKDHSRMKTYVWPAFGAKRLQSVTTSDIRGLLNSLKASKLAPRTIINIHGLVRRLFTDALAEELIIASPCVLRRGDLPKKRDKDPLWRAQAVFTREEVETLLSSPKVPADRKTVYAIAFLTGMREGEIAALRWSVLDQSRTPLWHLAVAASYTRVNKAVKGTKSGVPRSVPVHPTLQRFLTAWRETGFRSFFGRDPKPTDILVPNRAGAMLTDNSFIDGLHRDLESHGFRARRMHDMRRTFITLARTDGGHRDVLKTITHDQKGDQFDEYTSFDWAAKCAEVSKLKITGRGPHPHLKLAKAASATTPITTQDQDRSANQ